ncbi:glycosyltransferase family 4 protein [Virgibacillus siamensis]|uniref:glycosyltransferase family 4 protein n=1 Tax=Virgibacillus siamensis TaxID=480071 RepID=UPI0009864ED4|nr:glycosyltransferase family 4 protein [Virgibacillus siamensis]
MRILHLNAGNETGGGMHHILGLLNEFNSGKNPGLQESQYEMSQEFLPGSTKETPISSPDEFTLGVLEKGELLQRAQNAGIRTVHFPNRMKMSIPLMQKMKNHIKNEQIDIIHTHGPRANVYANLLKKMTPFTWVATVHSDPFHDFMGKGKYGNLLTRINVHALKNADRIIAISETFRNGLINAGFQGNRIVTALNGIDFHQGLSQTAAKKDYGFAEDDFVIIMVARLEPVKGHEVALKAFSEIAAKHPECKLVLVGEGSLLTRLKLLVNDLNISNHVHFMGHQQHVDPFYQIADLTMLTSYSESFPLVLLESARAKTPVIATDVGGVSQLIQGRQHGWKVAPGNTRELCLAMEEALYAHRKGKLQVIGDKLFTHASRKFSVQTFAEDIYNVYLKMNVD